jgi:hypothetical protein
MYTAWHVDKYKITFKLVIDHWPRARRLRNTAVGGNVYKWFVGHIRLTDSQLVTPVIRRDLTATTALKCKTQHIASFVKMWILTSVYFQANVRLHRKTCF